jgi:hypothetical protein
VQEDKKCPFCGASVDYISHGEPISYSCGTLTNDPEPRTMFCLRGYVDYLREEIEKVRQGKDELLNTMIEWGIDPR